MIPEGSSTDWKVQVFQPFPGCGDVVFGRVAARSPAFGATDAAGDDCVLVGAAAGHCEEQVVPRARGELLERMHNVMAGRRAETGERPGTVATFDALRRSGTPALDPLAWPELAARPDLRQATMLWVAGRSLTDGREVLVPAGAAYLRHRPPPGCTAPMRPGSTGIAAHRTAAATARHAALEVLERDLLWRAWYGYQPRHALEHPVIAPALRQTLDTLGLRLALLVLEGPGRTGCLTACLHTPDGRAQSFGARGTAAVHDDGALTEAAEVAVCEALMVRWSMGTTAARTAWRRMNEPEWTSPLGPLEHALHTFHRQDSLSHLLAGSTGCSASSSQVTSQVASLPRILADHTGADVVQVDTTVAGLDAGDTVVTRVVAPGARRLPADERAHPLPADARTRMPHPLG